MVSVLTLDFETKPITPADPWPEPVGVAIQNAHRPGRYLAWGHPTGNNCEALAARDELRQLVDGSHRVLMFNAPFDVGVAARIGVRVPWDKVEDAQILAFLADPYATKRGLKDFAHVTLGDPPDERDELNAWIKAFVPAAKGRKKLGEFIHLAPGDLVGRYARGDVSRTYKLAKHWQRYVGRAYRRELELLPVLEKMSLGGLPIDVDALAADHPTWARALNTAERWLTKKVGDVDLGSHEKVADALERAGLVKEWIETAKGRRSLAYDSLTILAAEGNFDRPFAEVWGYRSFLIHALRTFVEPWLACGGVQRAQWNGTLQERGGAVTGRLSSTPNQQNIGKRVPRFAVPRAWPELPALRRYVRAPEGHRLVGADISQQEPRIMADAVGGALKERYRADPKLDFHQLGADLIRASTGLDIGRDRTKPVGLAKIYGGGAPRIASQVGCTIEEARVFRDAHGRAFPEIREWEKKLRKTVTFEAAGGRT